MVGSQEHVTSLNARQAYQTGWHLRRRRRDNKQTAAANISPLIFCLSSPSVHGNGRDNGSSSYVRRFAWRVFKRRMAFAMAALKNAAWPVTLFWRSLLTGAITLAYGILSGTLCAGSMKAAPHAAMARQNAWRQRQPAWVRTAYACTASLFAHCSLRSLTRLPGLNHSRLAPLFACLAVRVGRMVSSWDDHPSLCCMCVPACLPFFCLARRARLSGERGYDSWFLHLLHHIRERRWAEICGDGGVCVVGVEVMN